MKRGLLILLLIFSFAVTAGSLSAQTLYLLCAGDVRDEMIGAGAQNGVTFFTSLFVENIPAENLSVYNGPDSAWTGADWAISDDPIADIVKAIESCPAGTDDGILILWIGRSGYVKKEFQFTIRSGEKEKLAKRSAIRLALKAKQVRFAGLLTESGRKFKKGNDDRLEFRSPNTAELTSLMSSLFFERRGYLDINSSQRNQTPLLLEDYGGAMIEAFGEFLEACDYKAAEWSDVVEAVNMTMAERFRGHKQTLDVFSLPKDLHPKTTGETAQGWRDDWNEIADDFRNRADERTEAYPENNAASFVPGLWSAPIYFPEAGDLLIGINGREILNYDQFIDAIAASPRIIYLTVIDHRTGALYEMRTLLGPAAGRNIRLGLSVVNDLWGGVRVTGTMLGSPASRCQYRVDYHFRRYAPFPYPQPMPIPDPWPDPLPTNGDRDDDEPTDPDLDSASDTLPTDQF